MFSNLSAAAQDVWSFSEDLCTVIGLNTKFCGVIMILVQFGSRCQSCGMRRCVVGRVGHGVSKDLSAFLFEEPSNLFLGYLTLEVKALRYLETLGNINDTALHPRILDSSAEPLSEPHLSPCFLQLTDHSFGTLYAIILEVLRALLMKISLITYSTGFF